MASAKHFHMLSDLPLKDQATISSFGRGPTVAVPHVLVHEAFEGIAETNPDAIAATFNGITITYQQLDIAANRLANHLVDSGLKSRQRVCLVVQRSIGKYKIHVVTMPNLIHDFLDVRYAHRSTRHSQSGLPVCAH